MGDEEEAARVRKALLSARGRVCLGCVARKLGVDKRVVLDVARELLRGDGAEGLRLWEKLS